MISPFQIILDIWEANSDIDYPTLIDNDVAGVIVRINDMAGGHHLDTRFTVDWPQAKQLPCRAIYGVYNPWVSGLANFNWFAANIPADFNSRFLADIEVKYPGYTVNQYADNVAQFIDLCRVRWPTSIYTGQWFLSTLSYWPTVVDYWWAAYPNSLSTGETISWDEFRKRVGVMTFAYNGATCPGGITNIKAHQCSGGGVIMPGFGAHKVDVSVFPGTLQDCKNWMGEYVPPTPPSTTDADALRSISDDLASIGKYLQDASVKTADIASRIKG